MNTLPLPERCLTLLPPWPQAIALLDKRLENRGYGVVKQLGEYRGLIGLSQSKGFNAQYSAEDAIDSAEDIEVDSSRGAYQLGRAAEWEKTAGKLWLVAEYTRVVSPEFMETVPDSKHEETSHPLAGQKEWHVDGQWGLIFGSVWEVEPIPCTGGVGAWRADSWCVKCGHVYADSAKTPKACYSCKATFWEHLAMDRHGVQWGGNAKRPELRVVRECGT